MKSFLGFSTHFRQNTPLCIPNVYQAAEMLVTVAFISCSIVLRYEFGKKTKSEACLFFFKDCYGVRSECFMVLGSGFKLKNRLLKCKLNYV
jgi:hypothetical protein